MFGNLGFGELFVIAAILAVVVVPFWRICRKAGYPGVLAIAFCIPIVNILMLFFLAFSEWPIERETRDFTARGG